MRLEDAHMEGQHIESVEGCELCQTSEIDPNDPRPEEEQKASKKSQDYPSLEINGINVIAEMMAGVKIADLVHRTGMKRGKLRRTIIRKMGGKASYDKARNTIVKTTKQTGTTKAMDKNVPTIASARIEDGWTLDTIFVNYGGPKLKGCDEYDPRVSESLIIDPDGNEYVIAKPGEAADLLVKEAAIEAGMDPIRLRRFESSSIYRLVKRHEALVKQGEAAEARRKASKRQRRVRRKGAL